MDAMNKHPNNLPRVFSVYVMELVIRAVLLGAGIAAYFYVPEALDVHTQFGFDAGITLVNIMWLIIFITIVQKFFPQAATSLGSRKQFKAFFHMRRVEKILGEDLANLSDEVLSTDFFKGNERYEVLLEERRAQNRGALLVLLAWGVLNT
ncbi:MAG: hypothetical protein HGA54_08220, partial [Actinobacteria bacterium]|nr:hypothetical protein [Actinomycetota bacterium]